MQLSIVVVFATGALAVVCPVGSLFFNPLCCATDKLGLVGFDCDTPKGNVVDWPSFRNACTAENKKPFCCAAPITKENVLCQAPVGAN